MPSISRIRFTNVVYENGNKRYIDTTFQFDGYNGILLLENGGGKTVFVQTLLQAVLPHKTVAGRKIQETLQLSNTVAHIAVEWIMENRPRRYALTAVSLFLNSRDQLTSQQFVTEYSAQPKDMLQKLPFTHQVNGSVRPATKEEMADYFRGQAERNMAAKFFSENETLLSYSTYLENNFKIVASEWNKIATINEAEGGVEEYFANCRTTGELIDRLLLPTIEEGNAGNDRVGGKNKGNGFVELFEKQREHFQKQIQLAKRIEEMQGVLTALSTYTAVRRFQYESEKSLVVVSRSLKALYIHTATGAAKKQEEKDALVERQIVLQEEQRTNKQGLEACAVAETMAEREERRKDRDAAQVIFDETDRRRQACLERLGNLEFADLRYQKKQAEELILAKKQALSLLDNDQETEALLVELKESSGLLHGWFANEEQQYEQDMIRIESQQEKNRGELDRCRADLVGCRENQQQTASKIGEYEGEINSILHQEEQMEGQLFPDSLNRDVKAQYAVWKRDCAQLDKDRLDYEKNILFYNDQKVVYEKQRPRLQSELNQLVEDDKGIQPELVKIDMVAAGLIAKLQEQPKCANIATDTLGLYQRAQFFTNQLGDDIVLMEEKAKQFAYLNRQAHRHMDTYGELENFTADALLEEKIEQYAPEYMFLKSGAQTFRQLCHEGGISAGELYSRYPFWAASVITTADEIDKVLARFTLIADELTEPLFILTEQELRRLVEGDDIPLGQRQVVPTYWRNVIPDEFLAWMTAIRQKAREADLKQRELDNELNDKKRIVKDLQDFFITYSFSEYRELVSSHDSLVEKQLLMRTKLNQLEENMQQCLEGIDRYQKSLYETKDKLRDLTDKIMRTEEYFGLQKRHRYILQQKDLVSKRKNELANENEALTRTQQNLDDIRTELVAAYRSAQDRLFQLRTKLYYGDVQEEEVRYDDRSYDTLCELRRHILNRLDGHQKNRGRLESELEAVQKDAFRLQKEIKTYIDGTETLLDERLEYPPYGDQEKQRLVEQKKLLAKEVDSRKKVLSVKVNGYTKADGACEVVKKRYDALYDELIVFDGDLADERARLGQEALQIAKGLADCGEDMIAISAELENFTGIYQLLERKNERLFFAGDGIEAVILSEETKTKNSKQLTQMIEPLLRDGEKYFADVQAKQEESRKQKDLFIRYAENNIREEKMRRRVVEGIRAKETYEEFVNWNGVITGNIHKIIGLSEEERKEHYAHIEHMVSHMNLYLRDICEGFKELGKKTRIKIDDNYKDIYTIHVPEWDDAAARTAIRGYLESITKRLDGNECCDEDGREDVGLTRKLLEKLLRTQQLLNRVIGEKAIKVKCRKATSMNLFSDRPYSWEESDKWSGGEKWSKNMALFLGCLNYLSEKRCHLKTTNYCNRVVLADNPFGKASSDHVLSPVFFIAQQLGFQIIALTAHDEGGFIRKYFPVVYSCRFADTANKKGQVLQPEKEIKTAFFEEHSPESLSRLAEYKEIGLF